MSLLPADDDLELIHTRDYETRVYRRSDSELLARGVVSDRKPPGLYLETDPEVLEIHQMQVELTVKLPHLEITAARVVMETHPHESCPGITNHYESLVGLSIARGFSHKVRELFGGPRGCTHTTALLLAMAPAIVQSTWSVMVKQMRSDAAQGVSGGDSSSAPSGVSSAESAVRQRIAKFESNINTCHVWDEDGEHVAALRAGTPPQPPLQIRRRMEKLGLDPAEWRPRSG